jgi:hypothetical protein
MLLRTVSNKSILLLLANNSNRNLQLPYHFVPKQININAIVGRLYRPLNLFLTGKLGSHRLFRSGVRMLLYLIKYSKLDIANLVREIIKVEKSDKWSNQMKSLFRLFRYVLDTKYMGQIMSPKSSLTSAWKIVSFSNINSAGDKDRQKSISGYEIYIQGYLISCELRKQKSVTLSSSEAEYVAISEVCTELIFLKQVLEFLGVNISLPIIIRVDDVGAIYLANNAVSGPRMIHVNMRFHFVQDEIEEKTVEFFL